MDRNNIAQSFKELQDHICARLETIDGAGKFIEDLWFREGGGGGRTRVFKKGNLIEKGGVNFSEVMGDVTSGMRQGMGIDADTFFATGVSIVLHPESPLVPIIHMNVRYFELSNGEFWFGGGIDLTPHYIVPSKAKEFHLDLKSICDKYDLSFYPEFKTWADDYFFLPHRNETRGIGGIFFDHKKPNEQLSKTDLLNFCLDLGREFPEIYDRQSREFREETFSDDHKNWQNIRRGRYVEFNLVNDRGTKFGLVSNGRTESILMSMPPVAEWEYMNTPSIGSEEEQTLQLLKKGIDWANF